MDSVKKGLLVMHYGTPASIEEVLPYYTHIRRGRPPTEEQLNNLVERYRAIGGPSPLAEISRRQAELIRKGLAKRGHDARLYVGAKHAKPFVGEAVHQMVNDGVERAVGLVLAPHYSGMSVGSYKEYAQVAQSETTWDMHLCFLDRWGTLPELIQGLADRVRVQLEGWDAEQTLVIFSAHSLPQRILETDDPYKDELLETAGLVAGRLCLPHWTFAFQSASTTGDPWLGPDILDVLDETAGEGKFKKVISCTVGFVSNHLEVLYDLGIEARKRCAELGLEFRLAACINDDEQVMDALAGLAASLL